MGRMICDFEVREGTGKEKMDFEGGKAGKKKEKRMRRMRTREKRVRSRMILRN